MNTTYLLIPITILSLFFYFLSRFLVRLNIISENLHRKIWNTILLIVFLSTAILGLLLVVQINYKLEWPFVKALLKWHVNVGMGLSFVALIHMLWHFGYYSNLFSSSYVAETNSMNKNDIEIQQLIPLIFLSGFAAMVIQVLLIREVTVVFEGNELTMGWMLGVWMLLTGLGALLGNQPRVLINSRAILGRSLFLLAVIPLVLVVFINVLKNQLYPIGALISPIKFLFLLFVVFSPICILVGLIYSLLVNLFQSNQKGFVKVYAFESIGSLVGGIAVSFLMIQWLTILQSLLLLSLIVLVFLCFTFRRGGYLITGLLIFTLLCVSFFYPINQQIKSFLFPNQKILQSKETYFGNLTITETSGQYNFFENGSLLFTTDNTVLNEEMVHYAMLQRHNPERVLIVSGGVSGMIDEILKYQTVKSIDYVEVNPQLVEIVSIYKALSNNPKVHFFAIDGRRFVKHTKDRYDIVIFATPPPTSLQINRFYTNEFLQILKSKLTSNAVIIYGLPPAGNYINPIKASIEASVYQTLKNNFKCVEVIPGEKDYLLASDSALNIKISDLASNSAVKNQYVNPYYIDDYSIQQRSEQIKQIVGNVNLLNFDHKPTPVFYETLQYISQFKESGWYTLLLPVILLLIPLFFVNSISKGIYIAGFSAASIEILLIFSFQILFGYVYSGIGLIIALFMGGLAIGSLLSYKITIVRRHIVLSQAALCVYSLMLPIIWLFLKDISDRIAMVIFCLLTIIPSVIVGFQYVAGTLTQSKNVVSSAAKLYSIDLIGSALGIALTTLIMVPLLGLFWCCVILAILNVVGGLFTILGKTK